MCFSPEGIHQGSLELRAPNYPSEYADPRARVNYLTIDFNMWQCPYVNDHSHTCKLVLQGDGNLVLYYYPTGMETDPTTGQVSYVALWASNTVGSGASMLAMQDDGNLVLYKPSMVPVWATHTQVWGSKAVINWLNGSPGLQVIAPDGSVTWSSV